MGYVWIECRMRSCAKNDEGYCMWHAEWDDKFGRARPDSRQCPLYESRGEEWESMDAAIEELENEFEYVLDAVARKYGVDRGRLRRMFLEMREGWG